jgi:hypothetical protein
MGIAFPLHVTAFDVARIFFESTLLQWAHLFPTFLYYGAKAQHDQMCYNILSATYCEVGWNLDEISLPLN